MAYLKSYKLFSANVPAQKYEANIVKGKPPQ